MTSHRTKVQLKSSSNIPPILKIKPRAPPKLSSVVLKFAKVTLEKIDVFYSDTPEESLLLQQDSHIPKVQSHPS
jgi:hypothetical protein